MARVRIALVAVFAAIAALTVAPSAAAAADTMVSDPTVSITLQSTTTDDIDNVYVGTRTPTFVIELLYAGPTVQCSMDRAADGPCGSALVAGCPAVQCWTYTPTLSPDGQHDLTVDFDDPRGIPGYEDLAFQVDSTLPDTVLNTPPAPDFDLLPAARANARPVFDFHAVNDPEELDGFQCSLTAPGAASVVWRGCETDTPWPRLPLTGVYRFAVRAVDILGRPDPTPELYTFSPTPCRPQIVGRVRTLRQIVNRGLRVRVSCVQPGPIGVSLELPLGTVTRYRLPSQLLGSVSGRTRRQGQKVVLKLRTLLHLPTSLFQLSRLRVNVVADETAVGASDYGEGGYVYGAASTRVLTLRR